MFAMFKAFVMISATAESVFVAKTAPSRRVSKSVRDITDWLGAQWLAGERYFEETVRRVLQLQTDELVFLFKQSAKGSGKHTHSGANPRAVLLQSQTEIATQQFEALSHAIHDARSGHSRMQCIKI